MTVLETDARPALLTGGFVFAEGPRWRDGKLWFSDMHGEAVYTTTLAGETTRVLELAGRKPSGLGFLPDGSALVVSMAERELLRLAPDGTYSVHARLGHLVDDELNDMVVAADGTAFVGSYSLEPETGVLLRVTPDGQASVAADKMSFPNGTVISPDGRTLTVAESKRRRFTAFDLDAGLNLGGRRVVAPAPAAAPDGIALDAEGGIWAAFPLAHEFRRILPGGEVTDRVHLPDRMAIACALGGPDRRTLFLLSAENWNSAALGGARTSVIETVRVAVPGAGLP
ncbi:SMP-30/gluconolactonase/LRE family protein [Frankia sp. CN7]|uniref:SMP-30/gluconolactonase/LRE family protein n=1 Tax=Frankia nepalensis TaxID=1836974 RepID=UPI001931E8C8|nr:SMP-30/gluconolactonase/LRE family protein [Frankia nepalensis]MBL7500117.1 SMP-30/gluconolactonase/LRE family protein [Frankia nepalensis]